MSHKGIRRIDVGFRMDEVVSSYASSTCIGLSTKQWNESFRFGTSSLRTMRSRRSLIKHFGLNLFPRLRLIGLKILLRVLERIDVFQILI